MRRRKDLCDLKKKKNLFLLRTLFFYFCWFFQLFHFCLFLFWIVIDFRFFLIWQIQKILVWKIQMKMTLQTQQQKSYKTITITVRLKQPRKLLKTQLKTRAPQKQETSQLQQQPQQTVTMTKILK